MGKHHRPECRTPAGIRPLGFALEPFDAIGQWRTKDGDAMIDAKSEMYDGTPVDGPEGVRLFLLKYQEQYLRNVTQNLLTYALGRPVGYADRTVIDSCTDALKKNEYRIQSLIQAIITSEPFRTK